MCVEQANDFLGNSRSPAVGSPTRNAGKFCFAGQIPRELQMFRADQAAQELERLYSGGNPQAMSYALVGMRKIDQKRYRELLASTRASDVTVRTMWGCIVQDEKIRTVADELDSGKYDPSLPLSYMTAH